MGWMQTAEEQCVGFALGSTSMMLERMGKKQIFGQGKLITISRYHHLKQLLET